jgi:hypothetical protein
MKVFIIGAGFTKALFPEAPLNRDLLTVLAKGTTDSASHKLIQRYHTDDIEIALTELDADIASSDNSLEQPDCGLRPEDMFLNLLVTDFLRQPRWSERRIIVLDPQAEVTTSRIKAYWGVDVSSCMVPIQGCLQDSVEALLGTIQNQLNAGGRRLND